MKIIFESEIAFEFQIGLQFAVFIQKFMTSIGKLNEVEQKSMSKKYGIFYCWTRDSANIED